MVGQHVVLLLGEHLGRPPGQAVLEDEDLLAVHRDVPRCLLPQTHDLPADRGHDHADLARDDDGLVHLA